ncbi:MAG: ADP-ribosylglycohydrolase family protein [Treponema sp.]|jgi:ADP-ribosylglycohydrolase|nr:ADP-ribosylglycohydrolase family protein [Treponema sp.]
MDKITAKQIEAVLLGVAVGDALGVPVEFQPRGTFKITDMTGYGTHNQSAGTWSDDTSLTLCLADAMADSRASGDLLRKTAGNFVRWVEDAAFTAHGNVFDIGISTSKAIHNLQKGLPPTKSGCADANENGNGSLMRIAPLVFYVAGKPQEQRYEITSDVSSITHAHPWSVGACFIYLEYMLQLLTGKDKKAAYLELQKCFQDGRLNIGNNTLSKFGRIIRMDISSLLASEIRSGGFVVDTLEAALWCFLTTDNYRDAVLKAVNLGDDTDTTAAVTGGLAGLFYGIEAIPTGWRESLARYDSFCGLAARLAKKYG